MKRMGRVLAAMLLAAAVCALAGCMRQAAQGPKWRLAENAGRPEIPEKLSVEDGLPTLSVYDVSDGRIRKMNIEDYVTGVVAGEMKNDWPEEALKAQAILARTFVMRFCQDKSSRYDGADISTDVSEAQAYDAAGVNARVEKAVAQTRGQVMAVNGAYPYAWFHAHSGGMTELPSVALDFREADPEYLRPVKSEESDRAPDDVKRWKASFSKASVVKACADAGVRVDAVKTVAIGEKGESGRAKTLLVNGRAVSAPSFRIQIGANRLKSTLIEEIEVGEDAVTFAGRGFGHGVGLSQWGAYEMAERGNDARQIVEYYFPGVDIVSLW